MFQNFLIKHAQQIITTLETAPEVILAFGHGNVTMQQWVERICLSSSRQPPQQWVPMGTIQAQIVHSRWLVKCRFCNSAMVASKQDRRFWCPDCRMDRNNGNPLLVLFPDDASLKDIETILLMRPNILMRNWTPGESVAALAKENLDHRTDLDFGGRIFN